MFPRESPEKKEQWFGVLDDYKFLSDPEDRVAVFAVPEPHQKLFHRKDWEFLRFWNNKTYGTYSVAMLTDILNSYPNCCR